MPDDPTLLDQIAECLATETADGEFNKANLTFLRSAVMDDCQYLLGDYRESDGAGCFVTL